MSLNLKDYQDALAVQDACNLSGVVNSFAKVLGKMWRDPDCKGTDWINQHPITILYADKIAHLTRTQWDRDTLIHDAYGQAYAFIKQAKETNVGG